LKFFVTQNVNLFKTKRNCKNLQYLSLAFCVRITDKGLSYVSAGAGLKNLVYIDLSGCHSVIIYHILNFT
jgi:F-box/leucine-rich repeat protein 13